ncbi:MAG TPA: MDR family MFS transporter, partial [Chitinophagaceae bacterium]|nr:MDR family MFS transporter [Chitinophagaceae bacterium]
MNQVLDKKRKWSILGGVMLAMLLSSLDQTIVATAMPTIVQDLKGVEHLSWVFTAYMLGSTVTVPIYGKLSDMLGRRRLYLIAICLFLAASALCGMAGSMNQLILFRGLQGIGGGAMMVNSFALIGDVFPPAERGRYQGLIGSVFGVSSVAGPLLGGWIAQAFSWHWVFYVNIPLGLLAIAVLSAALPRIARTATRPKIDYPGAFLITTTLVPLLLALVWGGSEYAWTSSVILGAFLMSLLSLGLFIRTERKAAQPILSLDLFRSRVFIVSAIALFLTAMGMFGAILYVPLFAQGVIGVSALHSGLILTPMMLSLVTASTISGQIISRTGRYKALAITGTLITVFALFYFSRLRVHTGNPELILHMVILGLGLGSTMPIFTLAVQSAFPGERIGEVTAGAQLFRSVGGTVGTAVLGGIMNMKLSAGMAAAGSVPFLSLLQRADPGSGEGGSGVIQNVLNPGYQAGIRDLIARLPAGQQAPARESFEQFLLYARQVFSGAIDQLFFVSGLLMIGAVVAVCFLPEVPLRRSERPVAEEAGVEWEEEWGQADAEHAPRKDWQPARG